MTAVSLKKPTSNAHPVRESALEKLRETLSSVTVSNISDDVEYFWAWALIAHKTQEHYPVEEDLVADFVRSHLEFIPDHIDSKLIENGFKHKPGVVSPTSLRRRTSSLSTLHRAAKLSENPFSRTDAVAPISKAISTFNKDRQTNARTKAYRTRDISIEPKSLQALIENCHPDPSKDIKSHYNRTQIRDLLAIYLSILLGTQDYPVLSVKVEDINLSNNPPKIRFGGKSYILPADVASIVNLWLKSGELSSGPLIQGIGRSGSLIPRFSAAALYRVIRLRIGQASLSDENIKYGSLGNGCIDKLPHERPINNLLDFASRKADSVLALKLPDPSAFSNPNPPLEDVDPSLVGASSQAPASNISESSESAQLIKLFEESNASLEKKVEDLEYQNLESIERIEELESELDSSRAEAEELSLEIDSIYRRYPTIGKQFKALSEIAPYIEDYMSDRIVLTRQAVKSLEESPFYRPDQIFQLFAHIYDDLYSMFKQEIPLLEVNERLAQSGMFYKTKMSDVTMGMFNDYNRSYKGRKADMHKHIGIGNNRDARMSFRLHFEWDDDDEKIIVHHAGKHLTTQQT